MSLNQHCSYNEYRIRPASDLLDRTAVRSDAKMGLLHDMFKFHVGTIPQLSPYYTPARVTKLKEFSWVVDNSM